MIFSELANAQRHRVHISCTEFNTSCITNKLHGAESFLRNSLNFIEPKVHYHIHKRPPPVPTLKQSNQSMPPHPISWSSVLILSYHLRVDSATCFFISALPTKVYINFSYISCFLHVHHISISISLTSHAFCMSITSLYQFLLYPMLSACPSHINLLDLLRPSLFRNVTQLNVGRCLPKFWAAHRSCL